MKLLELFLEYSVCPVCGDEVKPTLTIAGPDGLGRADYTLVDYEYPLIFRKHLEFGNSPMAYSIQDGIKQDSLTIYNTDVLLNEIGFREASINICCPRDYYHCVLWRVGPYNNDIRVIAIYPRISESIRIGKYQILNKIHGSDSQTLVHIYDRRYNSDGHVLSFKKSVPRGFWPLQNPVAFEEKLNKLILLK
jgi:hypothetical protein